MGTCAVLVAISLSPSPRLFLFRLGCYPEFLQLAKICFSRRGLINACSLRVRKEGEGEKERCYCMLGREGEEKRIVEA